METLKTYKIVPIAKKNPIFICKAIPVPGHDTFGKIPSEPSSQRTTNILALKQ